eukprot:TRINITY_DN2958_c0_g2_i1.p1 TRINITY_DN2958_c0_g2~~TRINITY_DN2958_c0_g2_i1.p1  ORF type:complete len:1042 (-),score=355.45 TRINITY_DN2958_c0_g2_i1:555-3641(-)
MAALAALAPSSAQVLLASDGSVREGEGAESDADGIITVDFVLPDDERITLPCSPKATIEVVKEMLWRRLKKDNRKSRTFRYCLKVTGTSYFLPEGETPFGDLPIVQFCMKKGLRPMFSLIDKEASREEKAVSKKIRHMVASEHFRISETIDDSDASDFRIKVSRLLGDHEEAFIPGLTAERAIGPAPTEPVSFQIAVYVKQGDADSSSKTLQVNDATTARDVVEMVCKKMKIAHNETLVPESSALKISGQQKYITNLRSRVYDLAYVRYCLQRKRRIAFTVVPITELPYITDSFVSAGPSPWMKSAKSDESPFSETSVEVYGDSSTVSLLELPAPFELKVLSVEGLPPVENGVPIVVEVLIYHGAECIASPMHTTPVSYSSKSAQYVYFRQWLRSDLPIRCIPEQTRLCITVWGRRDKKEVPLANVNCCLFDFKNHLRSGPLSLNMWLDGKANPIGTCAQNLRRTSSGRPTRIHLSFQSFPDPVVFPNIPAAHSCADPPMRPDDQERARLEKLIGMDQLYRLSMEDKHLLWRYREYCRLRCAPRALTKVLGCVNWKDLRCVQETYRLLDMWQPLDPVDALELLDAKFADRKIRETAVRYLDCLPDSELNDYLLQLVQVLKYEPKHFSALACWLVHRALRNRMLIGNAFFWHLQAEMHVPEIAERFGLLLEMYLRGCGPQRDELLRQQELVSKLCQVANSIKDVPLGRRRAILQQQIRELKLPEQYQIPLDPCQFAQGILVEKCKSMDSAKAPLWLVFENADPHGDTIWLIFKSGDDLRQDLLTLQMLGIMDKLWKKEGLDLSLTPYRCIANGDEIGMIETVLDSDTTANIQKKAGIVTGAFKHTPLANWLMVRNPGALYDEAVENFTRSCAGYCVATYVLGVGDRHNDNIMVNKHGFLFHIDFGHFLGNVKTFMGVTRERAPFILTPEFAHVMGGKKGENFKRFAELCCDAYNILRKHANVFINLFAMMLSTGIPELQSEADIEYLRDALMLDLSADDARDYFLKLINESLATIATQINFSIHNIVHS